MASSGLLLQQAQELDQRMHPLRLITVDAGEYPDADQIVPAFRAEKQVPRQLISLPVTLELAP